MKNIIIGIIGYGVIGLIILVIIGKCTESSKTPQEQAQDAIETRMWSICYNLAKSVASNPGTVEYGWGGDVARKVNGRWRVVIDFSASNAFGMRASHKLYCYFDNTGNLIDYSVQQG